ncbi:MAG: restriction endonuclease subunit S, partial [Methanomethylophilus alvi]
CIDKYDLLVKSRFIEMFGAVDNPKVPFEQLGNIATYVNGYAFKPSDWGTEGLPIIRIQNLSRSGDSFNYYSGTYPPAIEINKGDIMISWSATLGVFVWDGPKALLNQHIFKVYFDKLEVNPTYFRVAVEPALERSASKVHGSTMTHLTKKTFDSIMVPLPSINKQNEFASFVHQVDKSKFVETVEPDHPAVFQNVYGFPSFGLIST